MDFLTVLGRMEDSLKVTKLASFWSCIIDHSNLIPSKVVNALPLESYPISSKLSKSPTSIVLIFVII